MSDHIRRHIDALVAAAPPLSQTQRARVVALLRPGVMANQSTRSPR